MKYTLITITAVLIAGRALALNIPSDGSDGNFSPGSDIEVDLSQAVTGNWDDDNTANTGNGIYDPLKWAVVFKYASVNIPVGVTVTFKNHPSHAPVVWLVSGNVAISGTVNLDGKSGNTDPILKLAPTESGPGGFRGNAYGPSGRGPGFGPGGGASDAQSGSYSSTYGNPQILPLIGGSGGGSSTSGYGYITGGAGGGAILLGVTGNLQHTGLISANGGRGSGNSYGSGGAIRLIAEQVTGNGSLSAVGGGAGRIRIETSLLSTNIIANPSTIAVPPPAVPVIWPANDAPTARIVSVDGVAAPSDPTAPLISSADVGIQKNGNVIALIETTNFPTSGNVRLRVGPKYASFSLLTASFVSGSFSSATWQVTLTFNPGFSALQAIATVP
jgi:hypothetical protein